MHTTTKIFTALLLSGALIAGGLSTPVITRVSAQERQAVLSTKLDEGQIVEAGQVLVLPFYLNTNGVGVDGVQVIGRFTGVPVNEVRLEVAGELRAQALSQEVTNEGFSVMLSSADPSLPLVSNSDTLLFQLTVVPAQAGEFKIEYDNENTLVPSSADSANILTTPEPISLAVATTAGPAGATQGGIRNAIIALLGAGVLVAVGLWVMRKQSSNKVSPPTPPVSPTV